MLLQSLFKRVNCAAKILDLNSGNLTATSDRSVLKLNAKFSASGIPKMKFENKTIDISTASYSKRSTNIIFRVLSH